MILANEDRVALLAERAELFIVHGDRDALTPDDVSELLAELLAARAEVRHLLAIVTRERERQGLLGVST